MTLESNSYPLNSKRIPVLFHSYSIPCPVVCPIPWTVQQQSWLPHNHRDIFHHRIFHQESLQKFHVFFCVKSSTNFFHHLACYRKDAAQGLIHLVITSAATITRGEWQPIGYRDSKQQNSLVQGICHKNGDSMRKYLEPSWYDLDVSENR